MGKRRPRKLASLAQRDTEWKLPPFHDNFVSEPILFLPHPLWGQFPSSSQDTQESWVHQTLNSLRVKAKAACIPHHAMPTMVPDTQKALDKEILLLWTHVAGGSRSVPSCTPYPGIHGYQPLTYKIYSFLLSFLEMSINLPPNAASWRCLHTLFTFSTGAQQRVPAASLQAAPAINTSLGLPLAARQLKAPEGHLQISPIPTSPGNPPHADFLKIGPRTHPPRLEHGEEILLVFGDVGSIRWTWCLTASQTKPRSAV